MKYFKESFKITAFFSSLTDLIRSDTYIQKKYIHTEVHTYIHTDANVLKMVPVVKPWFEWLFKRHTHSARVQSRNVSNVPNANITQQVSAH